MDPLGPHNSQLYGNNNYNSPFTSYNQLFNDKCPGGISFPNPLGGVNDIGPFPSSQFPRPYAPAPINGNLLGRNNFNTGPCHIRYDPLTPLGPRYDCYPPQDNKATSLNAPPGYNQMCPPSFNNGFAGGFSGSFI
jgi:hypothetical protein